MDKVLCKAKHSCLSSLLHTFLKENVRTHSQDSVPDEWMQAVEFLQDTLALRPDLRLTLAEALQYPTIILKSFVLQTCPLRLARRAERVPEA